MKQIRRKGIVWMLVFAMIVGNILPSGFTTASAKQKSGAEKEASEQESGLDSLASPRIVPDGSMEAGQKVTWDCVWFGSYPQAEVVPASEKYTAVEKELLAEGEVVSDDKLYQKLKSATGWDEQGDITVDGEKYRRITREDVMCFDIGESDSTRYYQWGKEIKYHYFKYLPMKWKVLSVNGAEVFLLADKVLDDKQYHIVSEDVTWENSTIRSWLNGYGADINKQKNDYSKRGFIDVAFSMDDRLAIKNTNIENKANLYHGTGGGNNTSDKIFLLSQSEVYTDDAKEFGFNLDGTVEDEARRVKSTLYAKAIGVYGNDYGDSWWWLRSPGYNGITAAQVGSAGWSEGTEAVNSCMQGICPALNLTVSSKVCSYAGTVCSDGTMDEKKPPEKTEDSLSNPRIVPDSSMEAGQKVTWDCVWFGSYPQAEVVPASEEYTALDKKFLREGDLIQDDELYQKLKSATGWDKQGDVEIDGEKYRRMKKEDATYVDTNAEVNNYYQWKSEKEYHYFKYQPIKWRVLSVDGSKAFLLADQALDDKQYHTVNERVTWEGSTIRSWLNGYGASANLQKKDYGSSNFINTAFSSSARTAIKDTKVENKDNLYDGTEGGEDTVDKVFLLSESEVYTDNAKAYGFATDYNAHDEARRAKSSVYTKALGAWSIGLVSYVGNCLWWLRSPGKYNDDARVVSSDGWAYGIISGVSSSNGVRPALNLNLTAASDSGTKVWSYAGTVCSDGTVNEKVPSDNAPFSNPRIEEDSSMEAGQRVTWDCAWFGSYPQAEVVPASEEYTALDKKFLQEGDLIQDDELYQKLKSATDWDKQGDVELDGRKYRRIRKGDSASTNFSDFQWENETEYHYFKYQPIKWRVLSVNGREVLFLADRVLDDKQYHIAYENVTWENSTVRSWLNGYEANFNNGNIDFSKQNFISMAFSLSVQSVIKDSNVENKNNLSFGTDGGNNTIDKVFLLSESETYTNAAKKYGFVSKKDTFDEARRSKSSLYAKAMGVIRNMNDLAGEQGNCKWWLRSPGSHNNDAVDVRSNGLVYNQSPNVDNFGTGIRPALKFDFTAATTSVYSYAGTVCSDGTVNEVPYVEKEPGVTEKSDIADCDISLAETSYTYDGTAKEPEVTVKDGDSVLENGKDYKVTYSDNINAGKATVHITGIGDYEGKVSKTFTIEPKLIDSADASLEKESYEYDGTAKEPSVSVKDGETVLKSGTDYTVTYSDNISAGTAKVIITGKGNYTGSITKTFSITALVVPLKSFTWNRDNWNFNNNYSYFARTRYFDQINNTYLNKLKQNLTNSEYQSIFNKKDGWIWDIWEGSCYGMSSICLLSMSGLLPYSDYKSGAEALYELDYPLKDNNINSLITYYQMLQVKDIIWQQKIITKHKSNKDNISEIIALLDTNPTVRVSFQKTGWGGHAILAYGYEYGNYTWNGAYYNGCIKICDPNSSKQYRKDCNIYFNTETYDWTIPFYYSSGPITSQAGAIFSYVGADVNEINAGGYLESGQTKESTPGYAARIDINTDSDSKDYSVVKVEKSDGKYVEKDTDSDDIKESYSYILSGESKGTPGYDLFDAKSGYKVTQKDSKEMSLSINYGDCCLEGEISAGKSIIFDRDGYVEASGDVGKYEISMTFDGEYPTKWSTVEVSGTGSDGISVEKVQEGYVVSGDSLKNVDVELEHREDSIKTSFSTDYSTVCICELDKNTTGVKVDTDGNGTYETIIKKVSNGNGAASVPTYYPSTTARPSQTMAPAGTPTVVPSNTPEVTPSEEPTIKPEPSIAPEPSSTPKADNKKKPAKSLKKGAMVSDSKTKAVYKVTGTGKNKTVEYVRSTKKNASKITVPAKVKLKGQNYKVTSIAKNAFKNNKKLSYVIIGKNVEKIGEKAFYGCKKLRYIYVKPKNLEAKNIGKQAFGNGYASPRVKSAKSVWRRYAHVLPAKGLSKRAVYIINPVKLVL